MEIKEQENKRIFDLSDKQGFKDSKGKQWVEYDWEFLKLQMERLGKFKIENGGKYEKDNWKLPMDVEELKNSLFRHTLDLMEGKLDDEGKFGTLTAISLNSMFIFNQLKNENK